MSFSEIAAPSERLRAMIAQAYAKLGDYGLGGSTGWLLVDIAGQRLVLLRGSAPVGAWPVSTSAVGLDNRQDSGGTPPGLHRIERRIGAGAAPGTVFASREPTGAVWQAGQESPADLILTRILTLDGCENGLNRGPGIDSRERYIYLHGTNHEDQIGTPVSHGCVRLTNTDICDVFERTAEGDPVVII